MSDWPDLRILHAIATTGSLAGAGRELGVRHTTVGRRLATLEGQVGAKLVDRLPRGAALTEAGRELAEVAAGVDALMAAADRRARGGTAAVRGTVTVTAPPLIAQTVLAQGFAPLLADHPALTVTVQANSFVTSLIRNEADIALRLGDPTEPSLLSRRLGTVPLGLYASPAMATRPAGERRFIGYDAALAHLPHHRWLEGHAAGRPVALRTNDIIVQLKAAAAGVGVAMVPCLLGDADPDLERIADAEPPARPLWLLVHPDIRRSATVGAVIDHIVDLFRADPRFAR